MTYNKSLRYLASFVNLETIVRYPWRRKFNLERIRCLLEHLGSPHQRIRSVLIAGTKGKGSTAAILSALMRAQGYRVGLYTSPHLEDVRERIQIDGKPISKRAFTFEMQRIQNVLQKDEALRRSNGGPSYFEILTAMAFSYFYSERVDLAVVEVGLGGRLDATNILEPLVAVITSVSYDHQALLGVHLDQIAGEKAAIIKKGAWAVCAPQYPEAMRAIGDRVRAQGAKLCLAGRDFRFHLEQARPCRTSFSFQGIDGLEVNLAGTFQAENASVALQAAWLLHRTGFYRVTWPALRRGLKQVSWPGRFELIRDRGRRWILDGAHNGDSAEHLAASFKQVFRRRPKDLVVGLSEGKNWKSIFRALQSLSDQVILTRSAHPRAMPLRKLAQRARSFFPVVKETQTVKDALEMVFNTPCHPEPEGRRISSLNYPGKQVVSGRSGRFFVPHSCFRPVKCEAFPGLNPRNRCSISGDKKAWGTQNDKKEYNNKKASTPILVTGSLFVVGEARKLLKENG